MVGVNTRAKKVKKVKSVSKDYDYAMLPAGYLFWGECEVDVRDGDLEYSYLHRDCFLGNSDEQADEAFSGKGFVLKKLTGENAGCLEFPVCDGVDFFVAVQAEGGKLADYKISPEPFTLDGKIKREYKLAELKERVNELNKQTQAAAKKEALSEKKSKEA